MCLFDALQYASRLFLLLVLQGMGGERRASSGLFVDDRVGVFGRWVIGDEPESLILAQSERWRHA